MLADVQVGAVYMLTTSASNHFHLEVGPAEMLLLAVAAVVAIALLVKFIVWLVRLSSRS